MDQLIQPDTAAVLSDVKAPPCHRLLISGGGADWGGLVLEQYVKAPYDGESPPLQQHFICVNLGKAWPLWQQRGGRTYQRLLPTGDVLFMPAGSPSRWRWTTTGDVLHVLVEPELVNRVAAEDGRDPTAVELANSFGVSDPYLLDVALALRAEALTEGLGGRLFREGLATAVAAHLLRQYGGSTLRPVPSGRALTSGELRRVNEYVRENLASDLNYFELSSAVGVSQHHLARLFKQTTGKTLHGFVVECRLDAAQRLLRQNDLSVGQIASRVGFAQQSHLAHHMVRSTGLSPMAFRRQFSSYLSRTHDFAQTEHDFD